MGGCRIIDRIADELRPVVSKIIIVSRDPGAAEWLPEARVIGDRHPERGSLVGLHAALAAAEDWVLAVAWDMPFVTRDLLALVRDRALAAGRAAIPEGPRGPEPMCAAYPHAAAAVAASAIAAGDLKLARFIERLGAVERIPRAEIARLGDPERLFLNVNTPADLERAERLASR